MKKMIRTMVVIVCMLLAPCPVLAAAGTYGDFQYTVEDGYAVITGYTGESRWMIIPESVDGYEVRAIGDSAFEGDQKTEAVTVPGTVVRVGDRAFFNMGRLNNVTFEKPDSTAQEQEIGEYAFAECPELIAVALPANVKKIAGNAFLGAEKDPKPAWDYSEFHIRTEESAQYVLGYARENHYSVSTSPYMEGLRPDKAETEAVSKDRIRLTWGSVVFADRYRIYRGYGYDDIREVTLVGEVTDLYFEEDYLRKESVYRYYVEAVGTPYGCEEEQESVSYTGEDYIWVIGSDVYEMESLQAQPEGYTSLKLTWKNDQYWAENVKPYDNDKEMYYNIYQKEGDSWKLAKVVEDHHARSTVISGLKCGRTYTFAIQACVNRTDGLLSESVYTNYTATAMVRPAAPAITSMKKASPTSVRVGWKKVAGATGYALYRSDTKDGAYKKVRTVGSGDTVSCVDTGLKRGRTYYYKVIALRKVSGKNVKSKAGPAKGKRV